MKLLMLALTAIFLASAFAVQTRAEGSIQIKRAERTECADRRAGCPL